MINRNFKLLWTGRVISQLGDKFYAIALAWWILQRTNSAKIMGFFLFAGVVPGILLGFFTGALSDRVNRKHLMVFTDIIRGSLVLAITGLSYFNLLEVWQVFVAGSLLSAVSAFYDPASQAILPEVVEQKELMRANSMCQMVGGFCTMLGPLLGALFVSLFGMNIIFLANSISFYSSAVITALISYKSSRLEEKTSNQHILADIRDGMRFICSRKNMVAIMIIIGLAHFFVGSLGVVLPILAKTLSGNGINNLGLLETLMGAGLIIGATLRGIKDRKRPTVRTLSFLMICFGLCLAGIGVLHFLEVYHSIAYLPILLIIGIIIANASVFWQLLLQLDTPAEMSGRVFGISTLIGEASLPIAYGITGVLLGYLSISTIMLGCGACLMIIGVGLLLCFRILK